MRVINTEETPIKLWLKNIEEIMENQKDLVKILVELTPLGVIKG